MKLTTGYKKPIDSNGSVLLAGGGHKDIQLIINDYGAMSITPAITFSLPINADILGNASTADRLKNDVSGTAGSGWLPCKIEGGIIKYYNNTYTIPDVSNYLPLSGGTMTGKLILGPKDNIYQWLQVDGTDKRSEILFRTLNGTTKVTDARIGIDNNWGKGFIIDYTDNANDRSVLSLKKDGLRYSPNATNFYNVLHENNVETYALPISGGTMTGLIVTAAATASNTLKGIKFGNITLTSLNGLALWLGGSIRFSDGTDWNWNTWAGLKYDKTNKIISLGLADGTMFYANSALSNGKVLLMGIKELKLDHVGGLVPLALKFHHAYTAGFDWTAEIAADYYGNNYNLTSGFTHGMYFVSGRLDFDNFIFLKNDKTIIGKIADGSFYASNADGTSVIRYGFDRIVTGSANHYFNSVSGYLLLRSTTAAVGSSTQPIYVNSDGLAQTCNDLNAKTLDSYPIQAAKYLYHDIAAFCNKITPKYYISTNGTTFTEATLDKELFSAKDGYILLAINDTIAASRWEWDLAGASLGCNFIDCIAIGWGYSNPTPVINIQVEFYNGITWRNGLLLENQTVGSNPIFYKLTSSESCDNKIRITISKASGTGIKYMCSLKLLTKRWGNQGLGSEYEKPYRTSWVNPNQANLAIEPWTNGSAYLGSATYKWKGIYADNFYGTVSNSTYTSYLEGNGHINNANITHIYDNNKNHMRLDIATSSMTSNKPAEDGHILTFMWDSGGVWESLLFLPTTYTGAAKGRPQVRYCSGGTWGNWMSLALLSDIPIDITSITNEYINNNYYTKTEINNLVKVNWTAKTDNVNYAIAMTTGSDDSNCYISNTGFYVNASTKNVYANAYYVTSDVRLKNIINNISLLAEDIAKLPTFNFTFKDTPEILNSGTSAQEVLKLIPNLVSESEGYLKVNYSNLGTIIGINLAKEIVELKNKIKILEEKLNGRYNCN